ncbi:MAG TPA: PTS cellbiose transporter subunit IIC [Clostridiales bacterium]|jgi:predicted glycoside hydrolase/deacetylase ChbG (UPF0249 family)|nr:PTS cellbiose transporter subunit IIC [Clostridiales bacterium]
MDHYKDEKNKGEPMKKLIVVADDFGLSEAYSIGAIKAYKEGIVTVLSLMSNMDTAEFAVKLRDKECPEAPLAAHINFVQGKPVSNNVSSMVDEKGFFYKSRMWKSENPNDTKCVGEVVVTYEDAKRETIAQLERHKELTGQHPNHIEPHSAGNKNTWQAGLEVMNEYKIHGMWQEKESELLYYGHELIMTNEAYMKALHTGITAEMFMDDICGILSSPHEYNILHFHPGYLDAYVIDNSSLTIPRVRDLQLLTDPLVKKWLEDNNIELVDFGALYKK